MSRASFCRRALTGMRSYSTCHVDNEATPINSTAYCQELNLLQPEAGKDKPAYLLRFDPRRHLLNLGLTTRKERARDPNSSCKWILQSIYGRVRTSIVVSRATPQLLDVRCSARDTNRSSGEVADIQPSSHRGLKRN